MLQPAGRARAAAAREPLPTAGGGRRRARARRALHVPPGRAAHLEDLRELASPGALTVTFTPIYCN